MTREMFVRVAVKALRQNAGQPPEVQAEAIASLMDMMTELMGDAPAGAVGKAPQPALSAFPANNPAAVQPLMQAERMPDGYYCQNCSIVEVPVQGGICPGCLDLLSRGKAAAEPCLIEPATRIPDNPGEIRRALEAPPPEKASAEDRMLICPQGLKVEQLNALIQQRTPPFLTVEVPLQDGSKRRVTLVRDVLSAHAENSVKIMLYPQGASPSIRDNTEVHAVVSIEDESIDLTAVMRKLLAQAVASLRPRGPIVSVTPPVTSGAVQSTAQYDDGSLARTSNQQVIDQAVGIFHSLG